MNYRNFIAMGFSLAFLLLISWQSTIGQTVSRGISLQPLSVGRYTFTGAGTVNTYWIETSNALIVIDLQRDLTHAGEALAMVKAIGKPVKAILITHGHPDHFAGLGLFKTAFPDADIYSSQATYDVIRTDPHYYLKFGKQILGDDFPDRDKIPLPNKIFKDNETLNIEGVTIETKELGAGETDNATAYYLPTTKELFLGDIVLYKMHLFFVENHLDELIGILNRLPSNYPNAKTVYPGHGEKTTLKVAVKDQLGYIKTFRKLVAAELAKNKSVSPQARTRIAEQIKKLYPERGFPAGQPDLLELDVDGMVRAIQSSSGKSKK